MNKLSKLNSMKKIVLSFLKIGTIGFGGGSALIPVIEKEVVEDKKWIEEDKFIEHTIAANITPGALPVKLGASSGKELAGGIGAILGGLSVALPGVMFTIMLIALISVLGNSFIHYVEYASVGISIFIILLLMLYINKVLVMNKKSEIFIQSVIIMLLAFLVTGGKEVRQVYSIFAGIDYKTLSKSIFDISTLNLMIVSFFMIFLIGNKLSKFKLIYGIILSYIFIDLKGKNGFIPNLDYFDKYIYMIMISSVVISMIYDKKKQPKTKNSKSQFDFSVFKAILGFILLSCIVIIFTFLAFPKLNNDVFTSIEGNQNLVQYIINVIISSFTSFGGGEAYISVADGFFVQNAFIAANTFYSQVVAIANALPGPILVKVASAIGYCFGFEATKSILGGIMVASIGFILSVSASCIGMLIVVAGYDALKESPVLKSMKLYILPVVCGMLITTSISMLYEVMKVTTMAGLSSIFSMAFIIALFSILLLLHKKYHIHDVIVIIFSAIISIAFLLLCK